MVKRAKLRDDERALPGEAFARPTPRGGDATELDFGQTRSLMRA